MRIQRMALRQPTPACLDLLKNTAEAAFASDEDRRIVSWNGAAVALFGLEAVAVVGRRCHEVVSGRDVFGNRFCSERCAVRSMFRRNEPIHAFLLQIPKAPEEALTVRCSIIAAGGARPGRRILIHLLQREKDGCEISPSFSHPGDGAVKSRPRNPSELDRSAPDMPDDLTHREKQILRLLAAGSGTDEIAESLGISRHTIRNHIQHILLKLKVHSKLEAVCAARRDNLI